MSYQERANHILKSAIKSAIYIDEKARPFYQNESSEKTFEEDLSVQLYENFKNNGISLVVHKYVPGDENDDEILSFFTDKRDLAILDWKLKDQSGEEEALIILSKIVNTEHLHFCTIYTSESNLDIVFNNMLSYFSNMTAEEYDEIKEQLEIEGYGREVFDIIDRININRNNKTLTSSEMRELSKINKTIIPRLKTITGKQDPIDAIISASISRWNTCKSSIPHYSPSRIDREKKIVVLNNTIVSILKKDDVQAENLFKVYIEHIINDSNNFNQLLGLELHNNISKSSSIINHEFISFSKNALLYHRQKLKEQNLEHYFYSFMNEVLQEKISISLREKVSLLLDPQFLDKQYTENYQEPDLNDIAKINLFYNAYQMDKRGHIINFGDVFRLEGEPNRFLMCITPLCDCLRPQDNVKSNFYFAEGEIIPDKEEALKLGDSAFISFLPDNIIVRWGGRGDKKGQPLYIKPHPYKVLEGKNIIDEDNKITVHYINREGELKFKILKYQTTIRIHYAQRIANHAFLYPLRVGIDLVKHE